LCRFLKNLKSRFSIVTISWGEQDSNLRSFHSRFTVCPRWPLEYLPKTLGFSAYAGANIETVLRFPKKNILNFHYLFQCLGTELNKKILCRGFLNQCLYIGLF